MVADGVRSEQWSCPGQYKPVFLSDGLRLKCEECNYIHKGALRGFWSRRGLGACGICFLKAILVFIFGPNLNARILTST